MFQMGQGELIHENKPRNYHSEKETRIILETTKSIGI